MGKHTTLNNTVMEVSGGENIKAYTTRVESEIIKGVCIIVSSEAYSN